MDEVELPFVSIVLPIRNEARHIEACLLRLIQQDYPADRLEILIIEGASDDNTREIVDALRKRFPHNAMRILDNPARIVPTALNIGIQAARGEVIVRMDGHTVPSADYISSCVKASLRSGAASVGGAIEPIGDSPFGRAVAVATGHRLGAGDVAYRVGGAAGFVDTVPFGAFRREVFSRVGLFDESMVRNQDYEMNVRIRKAGERIYFDPAIRFMYTPRGTVFSLWQQYFQYGWWRVETVRRHPRSLRLRQTIPPIFVLALVVLLMLVPWSPWPGIALAVLVGLYAATVLTVARTTSGPEVSTLHVAAAFAIIHLAWGGGFLVSLLSRGSYPYRSRSPSIPPLE